MKKKIILFLFVLSSTLLFSCRKSHKCTCKSVFTGGDYTSVAVAPSTKRDAQAWCNAIQDSNNGQGISTVCKLD